MVDKITIHLLQIYIVIIISYIWITLSNSWATNANERGSGCSIKQHEVNYF